MCVQVRLSEAYSTPASAGPVAGQDALGGQSVHGADTDAQNLGGGQWRQHHAKSQKSLRGDGTRGYALRSPARHADQPAQRHGLPSASMR